MKIIFMDLRDIQFFDPNEDVTIAWKTLPHWAQAGAVCFITWRTADSLPLAAQEKITRERTSILQRFGLNPHGDWRQDRQINAAIGQRGEFWQIEQFDHLVRSPEQFEHYRRYIAENPHRASLKAGTYRLYSKKLG